jgi:hypothetical protein
MQETAVSRYIAEALAGVDVVVASEREGSPEIAWGDTFFLYNPDRNLESRRFPFATIVTKDYGEFDNASNLDRPGIYRLNISLGRASYVALFGEAVDHDYTALDRLMPHPIYGAQHWVSVLNPSDETFETLKPLLAEAHSRAASRYRDPRTEGDQS